MAEGNLELGGYSIGLLVVLRSTTCLHRSCYPLSLTGSWGCAVKSIMAVCGFVLPSSGASVWGTLCTSSELAVVRTGGLFKNCSLYSEMQPEGAKQFIHPGQMWQLF